MHTILKTRVSHGMLSGAYGAKETFAEDGNLETSYSADASLPTQTVSSALSFAVDFGTLTASSRQPYVRATCVSASIYKTDNRTNQHFYFGPSEPELNVLIPLDEYFQQNSESALGTKILWRDSPSSVPRHSVLMAFATSPAWDQSWNLVGCAVDAVWIDSHLNMTKSVTVSSIGVEKMFQDQDIWQDPKDWFSMSSAWAESIGSLYLNVSNSNAGFDSIGAVVLALAISNTGPALSGFIWSFDSISLPANERGTLLSYLRKTKCCKDPGILTHLAIKAYRHGYGYDSSAIVVQLSLVVLGIYCLAALIYLTYAVLTGKVGNSWDSAGELLMLGMNSPSPEHLGHVSAGIGSMKTFRDPVNIRVNQKNSLELVFANDASTKSLTYRKVIANERYPN